MMIEQLTFLNKNSVDSIPKLREKLPSLRNELRDERKLYLFLLVT